MDLDFAFGSWNVLGEEGGYIFCIYDNNGFNLFLLMFCLFVLKPMHPRKIYKLMKSCIIMNNKDLFDLI